MIRLVDWTRRDWSFDLPVEVSPAVLERLAGTPARGEELVAGVLEGILGSRPDGGWSVEEHIGHPT